LSFGQPALPAGSLAAFPSYLLRKGVALFRAHPVNVGPIWYSSSNIGFFTLAKPFGTFHLATDMAIAVESLLGPAAGPHRSVTASQAVAVQVTKLTPLRSIRLANLSSEEAGEFGFKGFDFSRPDWPAATRGWAESLHRAGFKGVTYRSPYDSGRKNTGISLFGGAGVPARPDVTGSGEGVTSGADAAIAAGFTIVPHQTRAHLDLI
jgi:hypothetical protein